MDLSKQNLLFYTRAMGYGGAEKIVLQMCMSLKPFVRSIIVVSGVGAKVQVLDKMGIRFYAIQDFESKSPKVILKIAKTLLKIIKEENITIIHTHQRMAAFYVAVLRLYKKCVFINTSHNTFYDKKRLTAFAYKQARLVACGEMVKKNLVDYFGIPDEKVTVIRNSVAPFDGQIVKDETIEKLRREGSFIVGNIGRLSEQKGMEYYIKALPEVLVKHPKTHFLIIGTGELEKSLKEQARQLNIEDNLHFLGYRSDIQNIIAQLDLVVLSSLWEGLPLTPIEAFSVKKTIVATSVDGTVEIIRDGENGFLIPPRDPKAIAKDVIYLIEHPKRRCAMEENGYQTFMTKFSFDVFSQKVLDYYHSL